MSAILIGLGISTSAESGSDPVSDAVDAETLGYDFVSASDHPVGATASYETLTLLSWIAARTSRISVATRVLGVPFRRPALVAKTAESLQRLSGGRLILGLGGGYSDDEIVALGSAALSPRDKVDGLAEAITIMRGAWGGERVTHAGAHHSARDLIIAPTPDHAIPIWLGTYGPRALAVTGRLADGWIPSLGHAEPARIPQMLARIHDAAHGAGREHDAVRAIYNVPVRLTANSSNSANEVTGSARDIAEQLAAFTTLGFTGFNLIVAAGQERAIADEVLPLVRDHARYASAGV